VVTDTLNAEIQRLESECAQLRQASVSTPAATTLPSPSPASSAEVDQLKAALAEKSQQLQALQDKIVNLELEVEIASTPNSKLNAITEKVQTQTQACAELQARVDCLQAELEVARAQLAAQQAENAVCKQTLEDNVASTQDQLRVLEQFRDERNALIDKVAQLQTHIGEPLGESESVSMLKAQSECLHADVDVANAKLAAEAAEKEQCMQTLTENVAHSQQQLQALEALQAIAQEREEQLTQKITMLESQLSESRATCECLRADVDVLNAKLAAEAAEKERCMQTVSDNLGNAQQQVVTLQTLKNERDELYAKIEHLQSQLADSQSACKQDIAQVWRVYRGLFIR
jgi:chromosome segregation ATPase